jgi:opacity protein-like surface antigen
MARELRGGFCLIFTLDKSFFMRFRILFVFLFLAPFVAKSQHIEAGLSAGLATYSGDLDPDQFAGHLELLRPSAGVFGRYYFNDFFNARLNFQYARLNGDDAVSERTRNLHFRSDIFEVGLNVEFNILGYQPYALYSPFSPYLFGGIAFFSFNPKAEYEGEWVELQPLGTEGQFLSQYPERAPYSKSAFAIPFGAGVKYALNDSWNIGLQAGLRMTFTDYLDDVSTTYISDAEMLEGAGELAAALANRSGEPVRTGFERGNPDTNDWYFIAEIFVSYNFLDNGLVGSRSRGRRGRGCYN